MSRNEIKRRGSFWENALLVLIGVFAFVLAGNLHDRGIPQKWGTAILGTLIPFGFVIFAFRQRLFRWSFWGSLAICLTVHVLVVWTFFQYFLNSIERFSILLWLPVMLIEAFVLLVVVKRIEEKFTGQHETMKPDI